jgi:hypothetical protein
MPSNMNTTDSMPENDKAISITERQEEDADSKPSPETRSSQSMCNRMENRIAFAQSTHLANEEISIYV